MEIQSTTFHLLSLRVILILLSQLLLDLQTASFLKVPQTKFFKYVSSYQLLIQACKTVLRFLGLGIFGVVH
jgi:hypothetical protein